MQLSSVAAFSKVACHFPLTHDYQRRSRQFLKTQEVTGDIPDFVNTGGGEIRSKTSRRGGKEQGGGFSKSCKRLTVSDLPAFSATKNSGRLQHVLYACIRCRLTSFHRVGMK